MKCIETQEVEEIIMETKETKEVTETQIVTELTETRRETQELKEITETREIESEVKETKDEHTHMELARDNEGELGECLVTRCKQPDGLLQERRETLCSLEADHDQLGPVALCEVEGASAVNGYTPSLGGMKTPGALVARIPSVVVPVCVLTSVAKCVLKRAQSVSNMVCVDEMARE